MTVAIATPAELVDALFFGHDGGRADGAWKRLLRIARQVSPDGDEDLAQDWAQWLLEHPTALASAQTLVNWSGLAQALRQHRERRRRESPGLEAHPSPETEQLRDALRKLLRSNDFVSEGRGRHRRYRLAIAPKNPPDPSHLSLSFDLAASDSDTRARSLAPGVVLAQFVRAWLSRPETPLTTLEELVSATALAGGHPFPVSRLEPMDDLDPASEVAEPSLALDVERVMRDYLRSLPRRRLVVAALQYGHRLGLEEVGPRVGVGKSTAGNESKAFVEGMKRALAPMGGGVALQVRAASLVETVLLAVPLERLEALEGDGLPDALWNDAMAGRFLTGER